MSKKSIWALKNQKFQSSCPKRVKNARKKSDSTIFDFWANRVTHKVGQILRPANSADFVGHTICPKIKNRKIWFFPCVFHPSGQLLWNFHNFKPHIDFSDIFSIICPKYFDFDNFWKNVQNVFAYSRETAKKTSKMCLRTPGAQAKKKPKIFSRTPGAYAKKHKRHLIIWSMRPSKRPHRSNAKFVRRPG